MQLNESTSRLQWLLRGLLLWAVLLTGRLVWLQVFRHDAYLAAAQSQQEKTVELPARRGSIFDRNGQPLAMTLDVDSVVVDPQRLQDLPEAATLLARALDINRSDLLKRLSAAKDRQTHFMWVARKISAEQSVRVHGLKLTGLEYRKEMLRSYPRRTLAANVLGSTGIVNPDDVIERGNGGVELTFEKDLGGKPGQARLFTDSRQNSYDQLVLEDPIPGADITLTLDPNLQYHAESELAAAVNASGAEAGSVVAMDPYTGEILAMASYPTFDPNERPEAGEKAAKARMNLPVQRTFEPGSVFKVITLASALETTKLTPESMIDCGNGQINLFGRIVHDHDRYSSLSMAGVLAHSSNIGAIRIGMAVGNENFYKYQRSFGFGSKTGIPLPGETGGILWPVQKWTKSSIGSLAMGHELGVTTLQLVRAGAAIANGGSLVKPRIVISKQRDGQIEKASQEQPVRILQPETAIKMRQMMEGVVLEGTGRKAVLQGYTSGGKTGSAQVYDPKSRVYTHTYNASFLGFAPVSNPRVVIVVSLHGTTGGSAGFGGVRAAPVFREVAMSALRMLDVPKDLPDASKLVAKRTKVESDLSAAGSDDGSVATETARLAALEKFSPEIAHEVLRSENGKRDSNVAPAEKAVSSVTSPLARAGDPVPAGESVTRQRPFLKEEPPALFDGRVLALSANGVPDFRGKTKRAVMEESVASGVAVEMFGDGLASNQDPLPGTNVRPGVAVKVLFGR
jgi:cell division protein FtsI (penicillin-binding protein 3)